MRFDDVLPRLSMLLREEPWLEKLPDGGLIVNRDLFGKVSLVINIDDNDLYRKIEQFADSKLGELTPWIRENGSRVFSSDVLPEGDAAPEFPLGGGALEKIKVRERLITCAEWYSVSSPLERPLRLAFYSLKGGVGRSTALAATAWHLARNGQRVLVMDLDFQAPGVSANLLPEAILPPWGSVDWLMEALAGNEQELEPEGISNRSPLAESLDGEVWVVPAYGKDSKQYVSKLGRIFLPIKTRDSSSGMQGLPARIDSLIAKLSNRYKPDVILIDCRAGIDDMAAIAVTDLGAMVLLFALDSEQTWRDYGVLFECWNLWGRARQIRDRLKMVAAMVPPSTQRPAYLEEFTENAYPVFMDNLYDEVPPDEESDSNSFTFYLRDEAAPHYPWPIYWHTGLMALREFHTLSTGSDVLEAAFAAFFKRIDALIAPDSNTTS